MNKLKKIVTSFSIIITGMISKVFAMIEPKYGVVELKYGVLDPKMEYIEDKYGVFEPTMGEKITRAGKFFIPIILFVIGLIVLFNKKITKKVKAIVISCLVVCAILGFALMNYLF